MGEFIVIHTMCIVSRIVYAALNSKIFYLIVLWYGHNTTGGGTKMLGARIATLRRSLGWSQGELARRLQVSASAVGMYEQGRREPSTAILLEMARLFGVTVDYLLTGQVSEEEQEKVRTAMDLALQEAELRLENRAQRPLSREELAVLFAALLLDRG